MGPCHEWKGTAKGHCHPSTLASSKITSYQSSLTEIAAVASFLQSQSLFRSGSTDYENSWFYHMQVTKPHLYHSELWGFGWFYLNTPWSHFCAIVPVPSQVQRNAVILPAPWGLSRDAGSTFLFSVSLDPFGDALSTSSPKLRRGEQNRRPLLRDPRRSKNLFPTLILFSLPLVE